jgi:hypothetical protein
MSMISLLAQLGVDSLRSFAILVNADPVLIWDISPLPAPRWNRSRSVDGSRSVR